MKIENVYVYGFGPAFHGIRNPMNSWDKSDTFYNHGEDAIYSNAIRDYIEFPEAAKIGSSDLALACKLICGGTEHRKFLRHIMVWVDFTLPRYVWTELDTYKVATVRNSCSTMHKLGHIDLTQDNFEQPIPDIMLDELNETGALFRIAKDDKDMKLAGELRRKYKNLLPEGFLQKSTYMMSYETALSMYFQRRNHRLPEWNIKNLNSICSFLRDLPYMKAFIEAKEK